MNATYQGQCGNVAEMPMLLGFVQEEALHHRHDTSHWQEPDLTFTRRIENKMEVVYLSRALLFLGVDLSEQTQYQGYGCQPARSFSLWLRCKSPALWCTVSKSKHSPQTNVGAEVGEKASSGTNFHSPDLSRATATQKVRRWYRTAFPDKTWSVPSACPINHPPPPAFVPGLFRLSPRKSWDRLASKASELALLLTR